MGRTRFVVLALMVLSLLPTTAAAAGDGGAAAEVAQSEGALASYEERTINLAVDWEGAQACTVWSSTDIRCYSSKEEMAAVEAAESGQSASVQSPSDCPGGLINGDWVCLYDFPNWGDGC